MSAFAKSERIGVGKTSMSEEEKEAVEEMGAFFDARAAGYDVYIRDSIFPGTQFTEFYQAISSPIETTEKYIHAAQH